MQPERPVVVTESERPILPQLDKLALKRLSKGRKPEKDGRWHISLSDKDITRLEREMANAPAAYGVVAELQGIPYNVAGFSVFREEKTHAA